MDPMMVVSMIQSPKAASRKQQPGPERTSRPRRFLPASMTVAAVGLAVIALGLVR